MYKVLIVDDELLMCRALTSALSGIDDFEAAAFVNSGEEAVEYCQENDVHLVLMDIALPGITGIEAAKRISKINPAAEIFIISVLSSFEVIRQTLSSNIRDFLVKPVSFSDIHHMIDVFLKDQEEDKDISGRIVSIFHNHNYPDMVRSIPDIVHEVFRNNPVSKELISNKFLQIAKNILTETLPYDCKDLDIGKQFPINAVFAKEETAWIIWLTNVMDFAFRSGIIRKHDYLQSVFDYIDEKIKTDINLASICDSCNISQSYLSKLFRKYMGVSVMDYIHLRKMQRAKMYMVFTDYSMTQIGHHLGYSDGSYFSKVFKKYEGMSPKQYKIAFLGSN